MTDEDPNRQMPTRSQTKDEEKNETLPSTSEIIPAVSNPEISVTTNVVSTSKKKSKTTGFRKKSHSKQKDVSIQKRKKLASWSLSKLNCSFRRMPNVDIAEPTAGCSSCVCTGYRRTEDHHLGAGIVFKTSPSSSNNTNSGTSKYDPKKLCEYQESEPVIDLSKFNPEDYPIEDCDERARRERAREIEEGVDPPPGYHLLQTQNIDEHVTRIANAIKRVSISSIPSHDIPSYSVVEQPAVTTAQQSLVPCIVASSHFISRISHAPSYDRNCVPIHTQVDYIHCLVPDILNITKCSFYWGKMDQYEAERLLEKKPEGTFLLRDSAQEDYLFSVSFRRYGRSLHARIEQWNHKFSFDAHDPGVFASSSVCGLIEHYKDPSRCMFFEPMLTIPLHRSFTFSLQHLCRSTISNSITYDAINRLPLPKTLKLYLKEYHYKQRVRVRVLDVEH